VRNTRGGLAVCLWATGVERRWDESPEVSSGHAVISSLALRMVSKRWPCSRSTFSEPNKVYEQALSQQFPLRLIDGLMPQLLSNLLKSSLVYWLPRSL
jgi:hypothetical protein